MTDPIINTAVMPPDPETVPEVTMIDALEAIIKAVECCPKNDSRRDDELMIVREYIDQVTDKTAPESGAGSDAPKAA